MEGDDPPRDTSSLALALKHGPAVEPSTAAELARPPRRRSLRLQSMFAERSTVESPATGPLDSSWELHAMRHCLRESCVGEKRHDLVLP